MHAIIKRLLIHFIPSKKKQQGGRMCVPLSGTCINNDELESTIIHVFILILSTLSITLKIHSTSTIADPTIVRSFWYNACSVVARLFFGIWVLFLPMPFILYALYTFDYNDAVKKVVNKWTRGNFITRMILLKRSSTMIEDGRKNLVCVMQHMIFCLLHFLFWGTIMFAIANTKDPPINRLPGSRTIGYAFSLILICAVSMATLKNENAENIHGNIFSLSGFSIYTKISFALKLLADGFGQNTNTFLSGIYACIYSLVVMCPFSGLSLFFSQYIFYIYHFLILLKVLMTTDGHTTLATEIERQTTLDSSNRTKLDAAISKKNSGGIYSTFYSIETNYIENLNKIIYFKTINIENDDTNLNIYNSFEGKWKKEEQAINYKNEPEEPINIIIFDSDYRRDVKWEPKQQTKNPPILHENGEIITNIYKRSGHYFKGTVNIKNTNDIINNKVDNIKTKHWRKKSKKDTDPEMNKKTPVDIIYKSNGEIICHKQRTSTVWIFNQEEKGISNVSEVYVKSIGGFFSKKKYYIYKPTNSKYYKLFGDTNIDLIYDNENLFTEGTWKNKHNQTILKTKIEHIDMDPKPSVDTGGSVKSTGGTLPPPTDPPPGVINEIMNAENKPLILKVLCICWMLLGIAYMLSICYKAPYGLSTTILFLYYYNGLALLAFICLKTMIYDASITTGIQHQLQATGIQPQLQATGIQPPLQGVTPSGTSNSSRQLDNITTRIKNKLPGVTHAGTRFVDRARATKKQYKKQYNAHVHTTRQAIAAVDAATAAANNAEIRFETSSKEAIT